MKVYKNLKFWLFVLTILSTCLAGAQLNGQFSYSNPITILDGLPFSLSIMFILFCHEMGHYLTAKFWGFKKITLPLFILLPFTPLGTMGALIAIGEPFPNRRALFDIGAGGPWGGILAILAIVAFIPRSKLVSFAVFVGFLVTLINLTPLGQLDGGHIFYSLAGERFQRLKWPILILAISYISILLKVINPLIFLFFWLIAGGNHPQTTDDTMPLDKKRKLFGILTIILFFLISMLLASN